MENRIQKEKEFHNKTFSDKTRRKVGKFYSIARLSNDFYKELLFSNCSGKKILEIGCGPGNYSFQLAKLGALVTGIDISEVAIEQAKERFQNQVETNYYFTVMNAEFLDFEDKSFDTICGISILHHLVLHQVYSEIARTLKPGGEAIFIEPMGHNPLINLFRKLTPSFRTDDEHPLLLDDINQAKNHFSYLDQRFFHLFTFFVVPFRNFRIFPIFLKFTAKLDQILFKLLPFTQKYSWIVVSVFTK